MLDSMIYNPWIYRGWVPFPHHPNVMRRWDEVIKVYPNSAQDEVNENLGVVMELSHTAPVLAPLIPCALVSENNDSIASLWPHCPMNDSMEGLADALGALHQSPSIDLPPVDVMSAMVERMSVIDVDGDTHAALVDKVNAAHNVAHEVSGKCIVHNDAHMGNSVVHEGEVKLIDCEDVCIGPPEWDFLPILHASVRFGKDLPCIDGVDWGRVESWLPIRDAFTCTWLATKGGHAAREELHRRLFQEDYVWKAL